MINKKGQLYLHVRQQIHIFRKDQGWSRNYGYKKLMRKVAQIVDETMVIIKIILFVDTFNQIRAGKYNKKFTFECFTVSMSLFNDRKHPM